MQRPAEAEAVAKLGPSLCVAAEGAAPDSLLTARAAFLRPDFERPLARNSTPALRRCVIERVVGADLLRRFCFARHVLNRE